MEGGKTTLRRNFRIIIFFLLLPRITGFQDCPSTVVGVADSNIIPDSSFTATSSFDSRYTPSKARFNSGTAWAPKRKADPNDYLQIDLGKVFVICAVATKGAVGFNEWTKEYKISTSIDGNYIWYPDNNNAQAFTGNTDRNTAVKHTLAIPVQAKLIRFFPTKYNIHKVLRVELYGVDFKVFSCQYLPVGVSKVAKIPHNSITSSSDHNTSTRASQGRLGYTAGSSWCCATSDSSPYLQIKLSEPYVICGVATQGDHMSKRWVQTYQILASSDGISFNDYKENNSIKDFPGNFDSDTISQSPLYDGMVGQYVKVKPKSSFGSTNCMRTELYGAKYNAVCSKMSLGVAHSLLVPNHRMTASSNHPSFRHWYFYPSNARLRNNRAWLPATTDTNKWLQIDLGSVVYMCAVATQGNPDGSIEYTKKYKLKISLDNINWQYYKEGNTVTEFTANTDRTTIVTNTLAVPTKVKFLRIYPTDFHVHPTMRVEVYGLPLACGIPFGLENDGSMGSIAVTSSSLLDNAHDASHARLYGDASWCSKTSSTSEFIQIDFGQLVTLAGIATQGDNITDKWVQTYTIKYSIDGNEWNDYREKGSSAEIFQGNTNKNRIFVRWLKHPTTVKYIKVNPQTWNIAICMRLELFGCPSPSRLKISELSNQNLPTSKGQHVTFTCKVDEPLVKYIKWNYDGTDVTSLSGGITRAATFVKSFLQVNYTSADNAFNPKRCFIGSSKVICRFSVECKVYYTKGSASSNSIQGAEVKIYLDYPNFPSIHSFNNVLNTSVEVKWEVPNAKDSQPSIINFTLNYWNSQSTKTVTVPYSPTRSHLITGLLVCTYYNVTVIAVSQLVEGPWSNITSFRTASDLPYAPSSVAAQSKTSTIVNVSWTVPSGIRCPPDKYKITFSTTLDAAGEEYVVNNVQTLSHTLKNLNKWTDYYIKVQIHNEKGYGPPNKALKERTLEDAPDAAPMNFQVTARSTKSLLLTWDLPPENQRNGVIKGFNISYCKTSYCSMEEKIKLQVNSTLKYVINDLEIYTEYSFEILAYTSVGEGPYTDVVKKRTLGGGNDLPTDGDITTLRASLVVAILVIAFVAVVVGVVFLKRRKNNTKAEDDMKLHSLERNGENDANENENIGSNDNADIYGNADAIRYQPIPVSKFNQYVNKKDESALKDEFKLFSTEQRYPWTVAKDSKNKPKNRYGNIITYDHSRVVLQDTSNGSDYVNASYIHGFDGTAKAYIATQGPKPTSVPDFWQMVWQENIKTIVMLTNLIEANKVKCHQYWPDQKETYGKFTVTLHRSDTMADYIIRALIICKDGESDSRQVHHFQYTSWPDKGVPQHATSVLGFRRKARSHYTSCNSTAPLLVHCSAGVGRTGAFIAIDAMMERVEKEKTVDIFNYVQLMRENRCTMVQTEDQYVFVHRAIQEAITCGNTEIPILNVNIVLAKLAKPRPKHQQTGYDLEWECLAAICPKVTDDDTKAGRQHNYKPRNRYRDNIPFDSARVFLSRENNDYINASFTDAFRERNAFIMTQAPLENTVSDFWYMIHQYKIGCIVMLNRLQEENESFIQYWPKSGSESYNETTVEVISESKSGALAITKCVINQSSDPKPHNLVHIQHTDWPKDGVPSNCQSVLNLVDRVQKAQQQSFNTPIVVQCSDGVGRSGTFSAIYSTLERVKSEQVVDVFQAIKVLRLGRPNAVSTLEQYKFCYKMVQVYLDSFNDYANFSEV